MKSCHIILFTFLACLTVSLPASAQMERKELGNLVIEGVPNIPVEVIDRLRQFRNTRSASFEGWDPSGDGIIIQTRFGQTDQLHYVKSPLGARQQLTYFDEPVQTARVCPDPGQSLMLFKKDIGGNEQYQLYFLNRSDGKASLITDGKSRNDDMVWSKNGQKFAYVSTRRNGKDWDIFVADVSRPTSARPLVERTGYWGPLAWSPDESKILVENYISINEVYFWVADVASGEMTQINPSDEKIAYGTGVFDLNSTGVYLSCDQGTEFRHLRHYDLDSHVMTTITGDIPWDVTDIEISSSGNVLAFVINDNGSSKLYLMDTDSHDYSPVAGLPMGEISDLGFNPDDSQIAFTLDGPDAPGDVYSLNLADKSLVRWTRSEVGGLSDDVFVVPDLIEYETFDEVDGKPRRIPAYYYQPKRGEGPFPVVVYIHGGPEGQARPDFSSRIQYWVSVLGVAVLEPNVRGSAGYGKTYLLMDNGYNREKSVQDIGKLLDWIVRQPELDSSRIAVYGGSYGGYMVLSSMAHYNDRLRAGVEIVGISNFVTYLTNTRDYRRNFRRQEYGDERDPKMNEFLQSISPTINAHKITKPLFIIQGLNDPRVPASEAEQILAEVRRNGGDAWYLLAKDEGHGFRKKRNLDFMEQAVVMFFEEHLLR